MTMAASTTILMTVNGELVGSEPQAEELFRSIYWATAESSPELMEHFPELSNDRELPGALVAAAQRAESQGLDAEPFFTMERIVRGFPLAVYSA